MSRYNKLGSSGSSTSSRISTGDIKLIIDKLLCNQHRSSTSKTYLRIWRQFNNFVINLDVRPKLWEDRVTLFIGHMIHRGLQSATVKTYVSAIKKILIDDGYPWDQNRVLLSSLTKSCRLINDRV